MNGRFLSVGVAVPWQSRRALSQHGAEDGTKDLEFDPCISESLWHCVSGHHQDRQ